MKLVQYWTTFVCFGLLGISAAWGQTKNEHEVTITSPVQIGSTQLEPGHYKVAWEGAGPTVRVQFLRNGKTVATSDAQVVTEDQGSQYDDVVTTKTGTNTSTLTKIDFQNQKESLVFADQQSGTLRPPASLVGRAGRKGFALSFYIAQATTNVRYPAKGFALIHPSLW